MNLEALEPFVDTVQAAQFLSIKPRRLLELARSGQLPAHPSETARVRSGDSGFPNWLNLWLKKW